MPYDPNLSDQQRAALAFMPADEREFVEDRRHFEMTHHHSRQQRRQIDARRRARDDIWKRAIDAWHRDTSGKAQAERDRKAAEAKAEAERAEAERYAAMTPLQREIEDATRKIRERWAAEEAAERARYATEEEYQAARLARYKAQTDPTTKPRKEPTMTVESFLPEPAVSNDHASLDARAQELEARAKAEPSEAASHRASIAGAEAEVSRAAARLLAARAAADQAVADAVAKAGSNPVFRERAKAEAAGLHATRLGEAEAACEAASLARDRAIVEAARAQKTAVHRLQSRQARIEADAAKAANDPQALGNPWYKPPVYLADWQLAAMSPEMQAKAMSEGARVYTDAPATFTAAEARAVLRTRGAEDRKVLTRAELAELSPADQAAAVRSMILIHD